MWTCGNKILYVGTELLVPMISDQLGLLITNEPLPVGLKLLIES